VQSPSFRSRGIGRYAQSWAEAIERSHPDLVRAYLLNPDLAPPGELGPLAQSGKLRYRDALDAFSADDEVLHVLAPIDLDTPLADLWPAWPDRHALRRSATVYDCIPALDPDHELIEPGARSAYAVRFECLRQADQLQVLSESVAADLERCLGTPPTTRVVGAAPAAAFAPADDVVLVRTHVARMLPEVGEGYVLYPTGSHPRKNNERLVRAWCALAPSQRRGRTLVLSGELPASTIHHLEQLAASLGAPGCAVAPGYLEDALLVQLYQGAALVCFPSLAEGFGLPIVEAIACGIPVVASDRSPMRELVDPAYRFDPEDVGALSRALGDALDAATGAPREPRSRPPAPSSWDDVADRSAAGFAELLSDPRPRRSRRPRRARLALVSPFPPAPTGIAAYSYRLSEELAALAAVDIDAFVDGPTDDQVAPDGIATFRVASLRAIEAVQGGYDHVVYALGNSHHHLGALAMLRRRRGSVLAHDVRLSNLYRHESGDPGLLPGGLGRKIAELYGTLLPEDIGRDGELHLEDEERYGVLMAREVVTLSDRFLVSSATAAELAIIDVGAMLGARVAVLPFAIETPPDADGASGFGGGAVAPLGVNPTALGSWGRGAASLEPAGPVVAHFGIVDPVKEPTLLLDAFASFAATDDDDANTLVFVGPISDALAIELSSRADAHGLADRVRFTGALGATDYRSWLDRADLAVQLRGRTNGEASAAVGECLAAGRATIVSDLGWAHELSDGCVVKIPVPTRTSELADVITRLANDADERRELGRAALAESRRRTFEATARALLELLDGPRRDIGAGRRAIPAAAG